VWVGVAVVFAGALCALGIPRRRQPVEQTPDSPGAP
jgi:hypothetical protein